MRKDPNEEQEFSIKIEVKGETTRTFKAKNKGQALQMAQKYYMETTSNFTEYYLITEDSITVEKD